MTASPFPTRPLGSSGPRVSAQGLGCMGMSALYGDADRAESIATIHAALDAGITLLDTGDFYGMGHNELLINEALRTAPAAARERALTSVKFGALRTVEGGFTGYDGRPAAVKNFAAYSLQRLGTDHIDVYRIARIDPDVPVEETVGAIAELVEAGHVRHIGLSEAARTPSAGPPPSPRSRISRSSTRCSHAASRTRSCRPSASWASASRRTACSRAVSSAATSPATASWPRVTSAA